MDIATTQMHRNITFVGFCIHVIDNCWRLSLFPIKDHNFSKSEGCLLLWWALGSSWSMWIIPIFVDSSASLLCLSSDLILFTRYKSNTKSIRLQCSIICVQDFHISIRASPKVFTLPFFRHDSILWSSVIKPMIATLFLRAGVHFDSSICSVVTSPGSLTYCTFSRIHLLSGRGM